jgi:inosine/xanthosine triphosphate pyrophosphatase family protein
MRSDDDDGDDTECALLQLDLSVLSVALPEIQEVDTLAIAKNKALLAAQLADGPCLTEDTSLCFHALGGMPGPYIKWFQQTLKSDGMYSLSTHFRTNLGASFFGIYHGESLKCTHTHSH